MQVAVPSWVRSARARAGPKPLVRTGRVWTFGIHGPGQCKAGKCQVKELGMHRHSTLLTLGTEAFAWRIPTCQARGPGSESNKVCWGKRQRRHPSRGPRERTPPAAAPPPAPPPRDAASLGTHGVLACCPESCGRCGGVGCELRPGGRSCCAGFAASHGPCGATGAPCKPARAAQAACCPGRRLARGLATATAGGEPQRPRATTSMSKRKNNGQGEHGTPAELRLRTQCTEPSARIDSGKGAGIHFHVTVLALQLAACCGGSAVSQQTSSCAHRKPRCFSFASLANRSGACDANVSVARAQWTSSTRGTRCSPCTADRLRGRSTPPLPQRCRTRAMATARARRRRFSTTRSLSSSVRAICSASSTFAALVRVAAALRWPSHLAAWRASGMANMRVPSART